MNWRPEQVLVMSECIIVWAGARAVLKLPVICCKRLLMSFRWAALGEAGEKIEKNSDFELYFVLCVFAYCTCFPSFDQSSMFGCTLFWRDYQFAHIVLHFQSHS